MEDMFEDFQKINKLACDVLTLSRNTLLVNLRFLDAALAQFEYQLCLDNAMFGTDGKYLFYNPKYILSRYMKGKELSVRDYLHMVFHCVFKHMYVSPNIYRDWWNLACDIAVEYAITGLNVKSTAATRQNDQQPVISKLQHEIGKLTAEKIYHYFVETQLSDELFKKWQELFVSDSHDFWWSDLTPDSTKQQGGGEGEGEGEPQPQPQQNEGDGGGNGGGDGEQQGDGDNNGDGNGDGNNDGDNNNSGSGGPDQDQENVWQKIAERMQMEMETFGKRQGTTAGGLEQNLKAVTREKYDYTAFLKKFATLGEVMKINEDEFDYIFYTYGLKLYDKMPLIEPLEYKEEKRIKEFVLAIDTSGSVEGELVQTFVQKTYNVLKSTESFFSKINLHIIQCDAEIQEHVKITTQEEFDDYLENMQIRGLGGTDFRPVFNEVNRLIEQKEFINLKGLIYFTDGYGTFPEQMPNYDTAFVFIDDEYGNPEVPSWAIKLILQKDEV